MEPEEIEMMKRQAAYHRLQWLRSEGERLNEENNSLKKRLVQMRQMMMEEQERMAEKERMYEAKKEALEATEEQKQETLDHLNASLEKSIIIQELKLRQKKDSDVLAPKTAKSKAAGKQTKTKSKKPKWNEIAASEIEKTVLDDTEQSEIERATSPFHYSPPRSPQQVTV